MTVDYVLRVKGPGVFCGEVSLRIRSFTLFVGPNGSGKSLAMLLSWSLDNAVVAGLARYLVSGFQLDEFLAGVRAAFWELVEKTLGFRGGVSVAVEAGGVELRVDERGASIEAGERVVDDLVGRGGRVLESVRSAAARQGVEPWLAETILEVLERLTREPRLMLPLLLVAEMYGRGETVDKMLTRTVMLVSLLGEDFSSLATLLGQASIYAPDGRAALSRILMPPYAVSGLEAQYLTAVSSALRVGAVEVIEEDPVYRVATEKLGVSKVYKSGDGVSVVYRWGGESSVSKAPSGVREALPLLLLLAHREARKLYVEEPEAHLHPSAVQSIAWALARGVKSGKIIIASTHDPLLFGQVNDLIRASSLPGEKLAVYAEELGVTLDALRLMLLEPSSVVVNVFRVEERGGRPCTLIESLEAGEKGYPEDVFEEVIALLAAQRAALTALGEPVEGAEG